METNTYRLPYASGRDPGLLYRFRLVFNRTLNSASEM